MFGHLRWVAVAVLLLQGSLGLAQRERPLYDRVFFEPCEDVVTRHIAWAKPYYREAPKVLFITHRNALREVVEISQRLSMEYRAFAAEKPGQFGETGEGVDASWRLIRGNSAEELADSLRTRLAEDYDVIVLGNLKWDVLPIDCRYLILKKVKEGTGLVGYVPAGRDKYLQRILKDCEFGWNWAVWSGGAQGIDDYFGTGIFKGTVDTTTAHSGRASVRIVGTQVVRGSKEPPRAGYHSGAITLEPNTTYVFSVWTRTQGLQDGGALVSLHPQPVGVSVPASEDWTRTETRFTTNDKTLTTQVYLLNYSVGTVWYDDVELKKVGDDRNLLPNPGFEQPGPAPRELVAGFPFPLLPAFQAADGEDAFVRANLQIASFGQGRVGFVAYGGVPTHQMMTPGPNGPVQDCRLDYDYYLALPIRLILWGARKEPEFLLEPEGGPLVRGERTKLAATPLQFTVTASRAEPKALVELVVRDRRNKIWHQAKTTTDLKPGPNRFDLSVPELPRGSYFADVWLRSDGRVLTFGSAGLEVEGASRIADLSLTSDSVALGEPLQGTVTVEKAGADCTLRLSARDGYGRLVSRQDFPVRGDQLAFSLSLPEALTLVGRLEAQLLRGKTVLDVHGADYSVTNLYPDRQDVQHIMWMDYPNDFIGPMMAEEFTRNGVDAQYGGGPGYGPYANQWWVPYATRFVDTKTDWYQPKPTREPGDLVRDPCLTNPAYRQKVAEDLTRVAERGLPYSTSDFTLGDENHLVAGSWDLCFSETCVADFRRWAQEQYGSLERLNASWGSAYTSWDEVRPGTLEECRKTGNYVPWVDHRLHMESVWAGIHSFGRDAIRRVIPTARVGYEGSDTHISSFSGADYWKLASAMDLNNIYYRDFLSLAWHDFAAPDMLLGGGWFGGYASNRNEFFMRWFPWRTLLKGSNSFWVWCGYGSAGSVMAFDLSLYPFFRSACEEIQSIKAGPGKLLLTSQRQHDGIALLYSASSVHVATVTPGFPDMNATLDAWVRLLHDAGLEGRVLSYAELAQGKLTIEEFKVLVLPCAQGLSAAEVEAIVRFAREGGQVIADLRPGVTDEHGKPYEKSPLDEVFGVVQAADFQAVTAPCDALRLGLLTSDGSLRLADGRAAAQVRETPVMISNTVGKGRALLLNFALDGYLSLPAKKGMPYAGWDEGGPYRRLLLGLLKEGGVEPAVRLEPELPRVEVSRFRAGQAEYVGVVQGLPHPDIEYTNKKVGPPEPAAVTLTFTKTAHVYDVRAGKYLGEVGQLRTKLTPGLAQLYALLPEKAAPPALSAPGRVSLGERMTFRVGPKGRDATAHHVYRVRLFGPDGEERAHYACNLAAQERPVEGRITFALDDALGAWKLVAADVATGLEATIQVQLAER